MEGSHFDINLDFHINRYVLKTIQHKQLFDCKHLPTVVKECHNSKVIFDDIYYFSLISED